MKDRNNKNNKYNNNIYGNENTNANKNKNTNTNTNTKKARVQTSIIRQIKIKMLK